MKCITFLLVAVATLAGGVALTASASRPAAQEDAPIFVTKIPPGYRDWRLISVAREEGSLDDIRAILGNDKAINAYREGQLPFPDGAIIARIAWSYDLSEENNKVFGRPQSFVAGAPKNGVQFMVKDTKKIRRDRWLGVRSIRRRQTRRCDRAQHLLCLPREHQRARPRLYPLRTLMKMNELLANILDAHGGPDRWNECQRVEATIVSGEGIFPLKGAPQDSSPRRMTVWLREERSSVYPYGAPDQRMMFTPERIAIEKLDGTLIAERYAPRGSFRLLTGGVLWPLKRQQGVLDDVHVRVDLRKAWASHPSI